MPFDLATRDTKAAAESGIVVHLKDPATDEPMFGDGEEPVTITILGSDAAKIRAKSHHSLDQAFAKLKKKGDSTEGRSEEIERETVKLLAAATIAWTGFVVDGSPMECNEPNARKLYSDPRFPWIVEQLRKVMDDRAAFFQKGSSN